MTTPRDDIAGLIGDIEDRRSHPAYPHHLDELFDEAATQLDSLLKERDALQARVKELEGFVLDEQLSHGRTAKAAREEVARIEQERDEARAALKAEQSRGSYHCD